MHLCFRIKTSSLLKVVIGLGLLALFVLILSPNNDQNLLATSTPKVIDIAEENAARLRRIDYVCKHDYQKPPFTTKDWLMLLDTKNHNPKRPFWWNMHFHVSQKHNLLYCHTPKAGSRTFLRYLLKLNNPELSDDYVDKFPVHNNTVTSKYVRRLSRFPPNEALKMVAAYKKAVWVRNPIERLVSAWKDKLTVKNDYFNKNHGSAIIRQVRGNATQEEIKRGYPVTLTEFFQFLVSFPRPTRFFDAHWMPMHEVCLFCAVRYDFVGHLENFDKEVDFLARSLTNKTAVPHLPSTPPFYTDKYADLRTVPPDLVKRILLMYQLDYDFFGYNMTADFEAIYKYQ